ncbi:MAG: hypothetical protein F6K10_06115 [Moorea sp. SIO2B7]|nr:hypothetical protein [Moorena sp. SIO2B7]
MRILRFWWETLMMFSEYHPPRFIEVLMLVLAMGLLAIWGITEQWPYLVLSLSYVIGSSVSILVREAFFPSPQPRLSQMIALLLLIISIYSFADLARYF